MNKGKKSILNAVSALFQMVVVSIIGLILTKSIISFFGSEYNGINSTVTQIINAIMILEGGFTLASNVALFTPFAEQDYLTMNGILSATKRRFNLVGSLALIIGLIISFIYPCFVVGSVPSRIIFFIMLTVLVPACFNLGIAMKYRVILLVDQKEYVISFITTVSYVFGTCIAIFAIHHGINLLGARVIIMVSLFANYIAIILYCKKNYPWVSFNQIPIFEKIKGTKSVLIMKLTSMFYLSFPVIVISSLPQKGVLLASVYAVYKSVTNVVGGAIGAFINAPRLGFGALFSEGREKDAEALFEEYEKITCFILAILLGVTCLLIIPFVKLYTKGVTDINYSDKKIALIVLLTVFFETIHIPSGQIIQMSGRFDPYRKIQAFSCGFLVFCLLVGRFFIGVYGIVSSVLLTAIILSVMEIYYTARRIFKRNGIKILVNLGPCCLIVVIMTFIGFSGRIEISSYLTFIKYGILGVIAATILSILLFGVVDRNGTKKIIVHLKKIMLIHSN